MFEEFQGFWTELEKEQLLGIRPSTFRKIIELYLSKDNLKFKSLEETEGADFLATSEDQLGKHVKSLIRIEKESQGVDKEDVEDLYYDMIDIGAMSAIFFTNSYFTQDAKEFSKELPVHLLDRHELSKLIYEIELVRLQKAFTSDIDDNYVARHFKAVLKQKPTRVLLRLKDRLESIDKRYLPIGVFSLKKVVGTGESRRYAYIDLSTGDLYYIDEGKLKKDECLRRILELPEKSREHLLDLIEHGDLPLQHLTGKHLDILKKKNMIDIYDVKSGGILKEIVNLISFTVAEVAEPVGIKRGDYEHPMGQMEKKYVKSTVKFPPFDYPYNLEHFLTLSETDESFDPDPIQYKPEDLIGFLQKTVNADVGFKYVINFPYYLAKYSGPQGVKYERMYSLKFQDWFPKPGPYDHFFYIIDKFPDLPYLILAFLYIFLLQGMEKLDLVPHLLSSSLLFVGMVVFVGILLKGVFKTERTTPYYATHDYGIKVFRYGFPSLHSLSSVSAITFSYFIQPLGLFLSIACTPIAALYIYSRVRIGAHSKTDVTGGAIIGSILGLIGGLVILGTQLPQTVETILSGILVIGLLISILLRLKYMH